MIYVEALDEWPTAGDRVSVFLAGGITDCEDWQSVAADLLSNTRLVVFNPRRANFPINDPSASRAQIEWEWRYLRRADRILFWFPASKTSVCPIALYELGAWSMTNKRIAVGVEPGYLRAEDVRIQTELVRPDVKIHDNLKDLVDAVR